MTLDEEKRRTALATPFVARFFEEAAGLPDHDRGHVLLLCLSTQLAMLLAPLTATEARAMMLEFQARVFHAEAAVRASRDMFPDAVRH